MVCYLKLLRLNRKLRMVSMTLRIVILIKCRHTELRNWLCVCFGTDSFELKAAFLGVFSPAGFAGYPLALEGVQSQEKQEAEGERYHFKSVHSANYSSYSN